MKLKFHHFLFLWLMLIKFINILTIIILIIISHLPEIHLNEHV